MSKDRNKRLEALAVDLSRRIRKEGRLIDDIHRFRGSRTRNVFIKSGVKDHYIIHAGGRRETQFNIGYEGKGNESYLRYGIAFSLSVSRTLVDPLQEFRDRIAAFNDFVKENPERFSRYRISVYMPDGTGRSEAAVGSISDEFIVAGVFIFIGKKVPKRFGEYNDFDMENILDVLDDLYPVYKSIEVGASQKPVVESRISRVCWNENGWLFPTGLVGKSNDPDSFERQIGYGHEEWLFNYDHLHKGMQYAYLQSVQQSIQTCEGRFFDIGLFSVRVGGKGGKDTVWVAKIGNVYVLTEEEREEARERARKTGQMRERVNDLLKIGISKDDIKKSFDTYGVFNIRFNPDEVVRVDDRSDISGFPEIRNFRYTLMRQDEISGFDVEHQGERDLSLNGLKNLTRKGAVRGPIELGERECSTLHLDMQRALGKHLREKYGSDSIRFEKPTGFGTNVDCYRVSGEKHVFYEVKTYSSAKKCIREALGQLFEYAFYPDGLNNFSLVVVGYAFPTDNDLTYLNWLSKRIGMDLCYLKYDLKSLEFSVFNDELS